MEKTQIQQRLAPYRSFLALLNWLFWNCLAVTTAFMVASAAAQPLRDNIPPEYYQLALALTVAAVYGMVDWGLGGKLRAWMRDRLESSKPNPADQLAVKQYRLLNRISWMIFLFLLVRIFATGLSSIWAGGEISDAIHSGDPTATYRQSAEQSNAVALEKLNSADAEYQELKASEAERIAKVAAAGDLAISRAVASGNPDQRKMYRTNPAFFDHLSPTSPWTPGNQKFIDRVTAAKADKAAAIDAEREKTEAARQLKYNTTQDTSAATYAQAMGLASERALERQEVRRSRHRWLIISLDWICLFGGLFCTYLIVMIDVATERKTDERSLSFIFGKVMERAKVWALDLLENISGLDINGDGQIGNSANPPAAPTPAPPSPAAVSPGSPVVHYVTSPPPATAPPRRPIGFDIGRSTADPTAEPGPTETPLANLSKPLAKDFPGEELTLLDPKTHLAAYRDARKNYFAWKGYRDNTAVSDKAKATGQERMNEYLAEMEKQKACLNALGEKVPQHLKDGL